MAATSGIYADNTQGLVEAFQKGLGLVNLHDEGRPVVHQHQSPSSYPQLPITRTVAIIKNHALHHRFEIEQRILEASFEIVKERQMEFDTETDPETLEEIFGEDAHSLSEGPVWVYILDRRRAVDVWNTLMGPRDTEIARKEAPNSLRALFGINGAQNGLMGSPDDETAEIQVSALFASSPPFPPSDLPPEDPYPEEPSMMDGAHDDSGYGHSNGYEPSNASTTNRSSQGKSSSTGKSPFRARPVPASLAKPDIVPRMTKSAALRAGLQPVERTSATPPRKPISKERQAQTFANVPGHKRAATISVASTAAPAIAPRMTKAASLRMGKTPIVAPPLKKRAATTDDTLPKKSTTTFEGVPGHKRRESISVASTKPPTLAPRLNKSAALRVAAPPTAFKGPSIGTRPLSRTSSTGATGTPSISRPPSQASAQPLGNAPASRTSLAPAAPRRASSAAAIRPRPNSVTAKPSANDGGTTSNDNSENADASKAPAPPVKPRARPSSVSMPPSIAPRTNRSAVLRAAKMEAEAAAAAIQAAKQMALKPKAVRAPPPSAFKTVAV